MQTNFSILSDTIIVIHRPYFQSKAAELSTLKEYLDDYYPDGYLFDEDVLCVERDRPDQDGYCGTLRFDQYGEYYNREEGSWENTSAKTVIRFTGIRVGDILYIEAKDMDENTVSPHPVETAATRREDLLAEWVLSEKFEVVSKENISKPFCTVGETKTVNSVLQPKDGKCGLQILVSVSTDSAPGWHEVLYSLAVKNIKENKLIRSWSKKNGEDVYMDNLPSGMLPFIHQHV